MANSAIVPPRPVSTSSPAKFLAFSLLGVVAVWFVWQYVFFYYRHYSPAGFTYFWPRRFGLLLHISGGMVALLTGPWQFSQRLRRRNLQLHRVLGRTYLVAILLAALGSFYLAATNTLSWAWGFALAMLGVAWVTTSGMAYFAVRRRLIQIHREWMIRSYVVTFAFVTFRLLIDYFPGPRLKPAQDLYVTSVWACWTLPLLATEVILQLRKMHQSAAPVRDSVPLG